VNISGVCKPDFAILKPFWRRSLVWQTDGRTLRLSLCVDAKSGNRGICTVHVLLSCKLGELIYRRVLTECLDYWFVRDFLCKVSRVNTALATVGGAADRAMFIGSWRVTVRVYVKPTAWRPLFLSLGSLMTLPVIHRGPFILLTSIRWINGVSREVHRPAIPYLLSCNWTTIFWTDWRNKTCD